MSEVALAGDYCRIDEDMVNTRGATSEEDLALFFVSWFEMQVDFPKSIGADGVSLMASAFAYYRSYQKLLFFCKIVNSKDSRYAQIVVVKAPATV